MLDCVSWWHATMACIENVVARGHVCIIQNFHPIIWKRSFSPAHMAATPPLFRARLLHSLEPFALHRLHLIPLYRCHFIFLLLSLECSRLPRLSIHYQCHPPFRLHCATQPINKVPMPSMTLDRWNEYINEIVLHENCKRSIATRTRWNQWKRNLNWRLCNIECTSHCIDCLQSKWGISTSKRNLNMGIFLLFSGWAEAQFKYKW